MPGEDAESARTTEMDDARIDGFLYEQGHGVLSVAHGDEAYAVPVSFGYDGDRIFLYLIQFGGGSKMIAFADETETACLTTYDIRSRSEWRCVVVYGHLADVSDSERGYMDEVMDDNGWFPSFYPPDWSITGVRQVELVVESVTSRQDDGPAGTIPQT